MDFQGYLKQDCLGLIDAVASNKASHQEILEAARLALRRIKSWNVVDEIYRESKVEVQGMVLSAIPMLHKDSSSGAIAGFPLHYGSRLGFGNIAKTTDQLLAKLLSLGACVVGRSRVPELMVSVCGDNAALGSVPNPFNSAFASGGSTAGLSALALGAIPVVQGADAGGSLRIPASWAGCYSMKPSRTHLSATADNCFGLDESFVATRSLRDLQFFERLLRPYGTHDVLPLKPMRGRKVVRIGCCRRFFPHLPVDASHLRILDRFVSQARSQGMLVEEYHFGLCFDEYSELLFNIFSIDLINLVDKLAREFNRSPEKYLQGYLFDWYRSSFAFTESASEHSDIIGRLTRFSTAVDAAFSRFDYLISPVTALPPPALNTLHPLRDFDARKLNRSFEQIVHFCALFNMSGHPALSLPFGFSDQGTPCGVQVVAARGGDAGLLEFAHQFDLGFVAPESYLH